jgi:hypothetical protein
MPTDTQAPADAAAQAAAAPAQQASSTPAPAPTSFDWTSHNLAPDNLAYIQNRGWKAPDDLATSYRNLEKVAGAPVERLVKIPGPKDDPKGWDEVFTKLGRPEKADGYVIKVPEGDKGEFAGQAKGWFHEAGLSQSQATKLSEKWNAHQAEIAKQQQTQIEQANQTGLTELKSAWGASYDSNAALVDKAAQDFGMTEQQLTALKQVLGVKGAMTFMHNIGSKIGREDSVVPGIDSKGGSTAKLSPEMAQSKLAELKRDPQFAKLFSSKDPKQKMEAQAQIDQLAKIAYPGYTTHDVK